MPFRDIIINVDSSESSIKLLLETLLKKIKDRITYAKSLTKPMVVLQDGSQIDRLAWIAEAETEQAKVEIELAKFQ